MTQDEYARYRKRSRREMDEDSGQAKHKRLVRLIRQLAREVAWEVVDEHLEEYEHKDKSANNIEV